MVLNSSGCYGLTQVDINKLFNVHNAYSRRLQQLYLHEIFPSPDFIKQKYVRSFAAF